jgi:small subunit ribosomal protein S3e
MESEAKGCEIIISGKLRTQRAKSMKFRDGYMIKAGQPANYYIDRAVRSVLLRQGSSSPSHSVLLSVSLSSIDYFFFVWISLRI